MKKTLLLSATAAILAGAFSPAVFADTTSGSTAAASSTPAPSATTAVVQCQLLCPLITWCRSFQVQPTITSVTSTMPGTMAQPHWRKELLQQLVHFQYKTWRHNLIGHFQLLIQIATLLMLTVTKRLWSLTLLWKQLISTTMPQQLCHNNCCRTRRNFELGKWYTIIYWNSGLHNCPCKRSVNRSVYKLTLIIKRSDADYVFVHKIG